MDCRYLVNLFKTLGIVLDPCAHDFHIRTTIVHLTIPSQESVYSKTSNNGPSEKRTTSVQRTAHLPPIDFTIQLLHFKPPRSGHLSTPNNGH